MFASASPGSHRSYIIRSNGPSESFTMAAGREAATAFKEALATALAAASGPDGPTRASPMPGHTSRVLRWTVTD